MRSDVVARVILLFLAGLFALPASAQEPKTIRIMVARSISAVPMLALAPFAEK